MSLLSDWWLPATPPTTMSISISPSQMPRHDGSGSLRSTTLSRSTHAQLSQHISDLKTTTIPVLSNRPGSTSVISTAWWEPRQPLRSCTTRCWSSIRTGSILGGRSGVPHAQLSHERVSEKALLLSRSSTNCYRNSKNDRLKISHELQYTI